MEQRAQPLEVILACRESGASPQHRLMMAVLEHAVRCYQTRLNRPDRRSQRLFRETAQWFAANDATWPFSFEPICESLGIEPEYLRNGLERWRAAHAVVCAPVAGARRMPPIPAVRHLSVAARRQSARSGAG
jgi:hypothetical protein